MSNELTMDSTLKEKLVAFFLYASFSSEDTLEKVADEFIEKLKATLRTNHNQNIPPYDLDATSYDVVQDIPLEIFKTLFPETLEIFSAREFNIQHLITDSNSLIDGAIYRIYKKKVRVGDKEIESLRFEFSIADK